MQTGVFDHLDGGAADLDGFREDRPRLPADRAMPDQAVTTVAA